MAKKQGRKNGSAGLRAEFTALAADFRKMAEQQADTNSNFDKRQKRFETALNKLAMLVAELSKEGLALYSMQEQTDQRLKELEKDVADLAVMMKATGKHLNETNKRLDAWLKLEQQRRRNGDKSGGRNGKRNVG